MHSSQKKIFIFLFDTSMLIDVLLPTYHHSYTLFLPSLHKEKKKLLTAHKHQQRARMSCKDSHAAESFSLSAPTFGFNTHLTPADDSHLWFHAMSAGAEGG